eukprot:8260480-Pyramimonas_sp.AAC.1
MVAGDCADGYFCEEESSGVNVCSVWLEGETGGGDNTGVANTGVDNTGGDMTGMQPVPSIASLRYPGIRSPRNIPRTRIAQPGVLRGSDEAGSGM